MGPSILFDKSAIQYLKHASLREVDRYFYTVVPPVLLMETLADLTLNPDDLNAARQMVAALASRVFPIDAIANAHYWSLCIHNLLGDSVPMERRALVTGGTPVTTKRGSKGVFIDIQPENEAVSRWRNGQFNEDDLIFANQWRESIRDANLEESKHALPKPEGRLRSPEQVRDFVDLMLSQSDFQTPLLDWFLAMLRCDAETHERIFVRWRWAVKRSLASFAPYACHCLRVQLLFYVGMMQGVFGTRPSNIVDIEYLYYTPFAFVFSSGDKLHRQLASLVLEDDQSFVDREDLDKALRKSAAARDESRDAEPEEDSLIWQLWLKHWKKPPYGRTCQPRSEEESKRIMESVKPIMEAIQKQEKKTIRRFPV